MSASPTLVFIPGAWHSPSCYDKVIQPLQDKYGIKCVPVTLPSTQDNPNATFKGDIDAARTTIVSETTQGHDVIVIAHSYGGMIGNSAIKGLTRRKPSDVDISNTSTSTTTTNNEPHETAQSKSAGTGHVVALVLIASGFTITGLAFMDPFFGRPPPLWRVDHETGYATLALDPREMFYHDVPSEEAAYWVSQLKTQSLKALFEGGEHAYAGWQDVPTWYIGTVEDKGFPVAIQRVQIGVIRAQGYRVEHVELRSSHSPFLSMPDEVVEVMLEVVKAVSKVEDEVEEGKGVIRMRKREGVEVPVVKLGAPGTWFRFGIPFFFGRLIGYGIVAFTGLKRLWRR